MNKYNSLSDSELLVRLQASDHAAYTEIYNRFFFLLYVHAVKKLDDRDQAKDLLHEMFSKLWARRKSPLTSNNLVGYLYVMLKNCIIDYLCHQQVGLRYLSHLKKHRRPIAALKPTS